MKLRILIGKFMRILMASITGMGILFLGAIPFAFAAQQPSSCVVSVPADHWRGEYFNNMSLSGSPTMVRDDGTGFLNFDWGSGSPGSSCGIGADNFSVRWTRTVNFSGGNYQFTVTADDGVRLHVDGQLILDKWFDQAPTTYTVGPISLSAGNHTIVMDYYENGGGAVAKLSWQEAGLPPIPGTVFETGWEDGQVQGLSDRVQYSKDVAGYFNTSNPPPECSRRYHETVRSGDYALMIAGYSRASYAYCYYRVFDQNIDVVNGMKISYWIYHSQGTPKIAVDGHFTDGTTIRDFYNNGYLTDQYGVRIHPGARRDPMNQWYYVEVDLSKAVGKTIDFIMFAFDNGNDGFIGQYRTYVDDFQILLYDEPVSLTSGHPKGSFGSGGQTHEVTEPETWRWAEWFYGHWGIDQIASQYDACGGWHNYAIGLHQGDLIEYLVKFGGDYSRLWLRGIADRPGPVEFEIYIDGQYQAMASWDNNNDCNQDVAVDILSIPYGTHAIAVKFTNDYWNLFMGERNFYLGGLFVTHSPSSGSSVTLAWDPPTTNVDGTPLEDLAGYKIYYGGSSRDYTVSIDVGNVTAYRIDNLPPGTYYFAATAYDTSGNESEYSNEVSKPR